MNCSICHIQLQRIDLLQSALPAYRCPQCEGVWISANEYLRWRQAQGPTLPERVADISNIPKIDVPQVKLCPADGHFLRRYHVIANEEFYLDRCTYCNGVWFDKGEWDVLVARNLHDKLNQFFTQPYQSHLQEQEAYTALDRFYLGKFGEEDYGRIREIRDWLTNHPKRAMLLAYLQAENPYKM
ncbi:MAG: zf-TFIIB domain-containing protein [Anaerolineae bacterium]